MLRQDPTGTRDANNADELCYEDQVLFFFKGLLKDWDAELDLRKDEVRLLTVVSFVAALSTVVTAYAPRACPRLPAAASRHQCGHVGSAARDVLQCECKHAQRNVSGG
jgi:hypothetical protein